MKGLRLLFCMYNSLLCASPSRNATRRALVRAEVEEELQTMTGCRPKTRAAVGSDWAGPQKRILLARRRRIVIVDPSRVAIQ